MRCLEKEKVGVEGLRSFELASGEDKKLPDKA